MRIQNIINNKRYILCSTCPPPAATHAADRLLCTQPTYSKSVMVSVGVSALGRTNLHFVDPGVKVNVSIIETYCLREIFCPILRSTRITSHFSRTEPQRIGLAKLLNSWKTRRQTSFHQICGHPTAQWTTGSGAYCKNGFTRQAVRMSTSYDACLLYTSPSPRD